MLNTCSIGRRWKSREGWSRPVLTGERGTLSDPLVGSGLVLWWFLSLDGKEHCFLVVTETILVRRFCLRPLSGSRTATIGIVVGSVAGRSVWLAVHSGFAVVMAQVRRPVPFRTRKLRPGRGDGTALERVWESSTPPHSFVGVPVERDAPGTPILFVLLCRPAGRSTLPRGSGRGSAGDTEFVTANQSGAHWGCVLGDRDDIRHACQPTCLRVQTLAT